MQATANGKRTHVRESARQRRLEIIEATLRVMRRDGLRAITHRAVAAEAGVPLAATTYYFRDLEDLITESFLHWCTAQRRVVKAFHDSALELAAGGLAAGMAPGELAARLADATADYVAEQAGLYRDDRVLELAFLHEALRLPRLREAVELHQNSLLALLTGFHAALGSVQPAADAQISNSLVLGLERSVMLSAASSVDREGIRAVLLRYLRAMLGLVAEVPDPDGLGARIAGPRPAGKSTKRGSDGKKPLSPIS
jgi:DNA-binding transcriptional regulator YbjK